MFGLKKNIQAAIEERIKRLADVFLKNGETDHGMAGFADHWSELKESFQACQKNEGDASLRDAFLASVKKGIAMRGKDYIAVIQGLAPADSNTGSRWLQGIVDGIVGEAQRILPSLAVCSGNNTPV